MIEKQSDLGDLILVCRNRRWSEIGSRPGLSYLKLCAIYNLLIALVPAGIIASQLGVPTPFLEQPPFYGVYIGVYVLLVSVFLWCGTFVPAPRLRLFENGIQYQNRSFHFNQVREIFLGFELSKLSTKLKSINDWFARLPLTEASSARLTQEEENRLQENSVTFQLIDGSAVVLKNVYAMVVETDIEKFFEIVNQKLPGFLDGGSSTK